MDPLFFARVLVCSFFAVCFLQSGFDKVFHWRENQEWLNGHFGATVIARLVPLLLATITVLEVVAGVASGFAATLLLMRVETTLPGYAMFLSALTVLCLFAGQRLAKDYPGAATLATYFLVALAGLHFMR